MEFKGRERCMLKSKKAKKYKETDRTEITEIEIQQRTVLKNGVTSYLEWRDNKNEPDGRGYQQGFFTWLRHYSSFGKDRAEALRHTLSENLDLYPIQLLNNHFNAYSTVNNHSLDTYLLERILNNRQLFLIPKEFDTLNTVSEREAFRDFLQYHDFYPDIEGNYAYSVAQMYENDTSLQDHLQKACDYYAIGIQYNHRESIEAVNTLAQGGIKEAQYVLGVEFYYNKKKLEVEAINWCLSALEQQYAPAKTFLFEAPFSLECYLMLARRYEQGDEIKKSKNSALIFYKKAYDLDSKEAAFRLGQLYESINMKQAFDYYKKAARQGDEAAIEAMIKSAEQLNDDNLRYKIGQLYLEMSIHRLNALTCFKTLADKNHKNARNLLDKLTTDNPKDAYDIAQLYQQENNLQKACSYYSKAIVHKHPASVEAIKALAEKGIGEALFILGAEYHGPRGEFDALVHCCIAAVEVHHSKAKAYLFDGTFSMERYLIIARCYEQKDQGHALDSILFFYKKACALGSQEAAFRLGQLYEPKDKKQSFNYYHMAAKQKDTAALEAMIKNAEALDDDNLRYEIGILYLEVFKNYLNALISFKNLTEKHMEKAKTQLTRLTGSEAKFAYIVATLYQDDVSLKNHFKKACIYYALSDQQGYEKAKEQLNALLNSNETSAEDLTLIGELYYCGLNGITKDYEQAKHYFEKACEKNYGVATHYLGLMYQNGYGFRKQPTKAIQYYQKAESQGHASSQKKLEELLNSNQLRPEDLTQLASMYEKGSHGMSINRSLAITLYEKASQRGDSKAAYALGQFYEIDHEGVPKNRTRSFHAFLQAAKQGKNEALIPLERLGNKVSAKEQIELSKIYVSFFYNQEKADYWKNKANEVGSFKFQG